ncbi:MAG: VCBS repeat-containing protein [Planctomycetes bacterium]|nr:VCBS repeat-containing protein [Planctomycetota bacterium]
MGVDLEAQQPLQFLPPIVYDLGNEAPSRPTAADFDEDGHPDLVVGCFGATQQFPGGQLGILFGTGAGGFEDLDQISSGPRFGPPAVGDFDLDGHQDIAVVRNYPVLQPEIVLFFGDGARGFSVEMPLAASTPAYRLVSVDLDHDGAPDLVNTNSTGGFSILRNNGDGTFAPPVPYGAGEPMDVRVCDMNLDGNADLVVGERFGSVTVHLGDGLGHFVGGGGASGGSTFQQWTRVGVGDVDGGGPDVFWGTSFPFATWAAQGGGDGSLSSATILVPSLSAFEIEVADFDGDGAGDIALIYGAGSQVLRGHGDGTFDAGVVLPVPTRGDGGLVLDVDGDGRPDVVTVDRNSGNNGLCSVYLNATPVVTAQAYCFGDGTGAACPCANNGTAGNGCANSGFAGGANLSATGTPSVAADTVTLTASNLTGSVAVFFQGATQTPATIIDDGLGCVGGPIVRLGSKPAAGTSFYPQPGDPRISIRGALPAAGGTFYYQSFYRNAAAAFCPPATSNRTNGVAVTWVP